jgi:hypothetical protein
VNTSCPNCGATFSPEEFNLPSCKYCGKVLPNYAAAAQKVAVVKALLHDSTGSGVPDGLKGMVGPYAPLLPVAVPPPYGGPYAGPPVAGAPPPPAGPPGYGAAMAIPSIIEQTQRRIRRALFWGIVLPVGVLVVIGVVLAFVFAGAHTNPSPSSNKARHSMRSMPADASPAT